MMYATVVVPGGCISLRFLSIVLLLEEDANLAELISITHSKKFHCLFYSQGNDDRWTVELVGPPVNETYIR